MANAQPAQQQLYRLPHLAKRIGASGSSIWAWVKNGTFPAPIKISPNCTCWIAAEVEQSAVVRIADSRKAA
ncbi:MAG: AlpA family phage regulatory protein [Gallionella sp.]|nr:AlpA family phage regulatory protein [Gallionella sp.]